MDMHTLAACNALIGVLAFILLARATGRSILHRPPQERHLGLLSLGYVLVVVIGCTNAAVGTGRPSWVQWLILALNAALIVRIWRWDPDVEDDMLTGRA